MELKQFKVAERRTDWYCHIIAHNKDSAWRKFNTQRFGVLKPNPNDYAVSFIKFIEL